VTAELCALKSPAQVVATKHFFIISLYSKLLLITLMWLNTFPFYWAHLHLIKQQNISPVHEKFYVNSQGGFAKMTTCCPKSTCQIETEIVFYIQAQNCRGISPTYFIRHLLLFTWKEKRFSLFKQPWGFSPRGFLLIPFLFISTDHKQAIQFTISVPSCIAISLKTYNFLHIRTLLEGFWTQTHEFCT